MEQNRGFTGLEGTEDAWLLKDDEYIAAMLRRQNPFSEAQPHQNEVYSLQELDLLGQYASGLSALEAKADPYAICEERIGLDLAVLSMKTDTLSRERMVSSALKVTLQKTLNGYLNHFLEQFNRKLETNRKNARIEADIQGNAELDSDSVWKVYNKTMEKYRVSGNVMEALIKGVEYGRSQYAEKMNSEYSKGIYRYKNSGFYWSDFFGNLSGQKTGSYNKNGSTYEQYMMGWLDFQKSLEDGNQVRMNVFLRSINSYSVNQSGNWVNSVC